MQELQPLLVVLVISVLRCLRQSRSPMLVGTQLVFICKDRLCKQFTGGKIWSGKFV